MAHKDLNKQPKRVSAQKQQNWLPVGFVGLGAVLLIGVFILAFGQSRPSEAQSVHPPRIGSTLSDFSLTNVQGKTVALRDYQGQVVLVNSWATWCPPCRAEMPDLNAYYHTHHSEGFVVLAINAGDPQEKAAAFAQQNNLNFPVLLDPELHLLDGFNIHDFPTSLVVGRDGLVKNIHIGMYSPEALEQDITPLLAQ